MKTYEEIQAVLRPIVAGLVASLVTLGILLATGADPIHYGWVGFFAAAFAVDAFVQRREYFYYADLLDRGYPAVYVLRSLKGTYCSRGVAIALLGDEARLFYDALGYRWYHVVPDKI